MTPCARPTVPRIVALALFGVLGVPLSAAACSVCFGDPEQSGPVQAAILVLLALVVLVQVVLGRLLWGLMRRSRSSTSFRGAGRAGS